MPRAVVTPTTRSDVSSRARGREREGITCARIGIHTGVYRRVKFGRLPEASAAVTTSLLPLSITLFISISSSSSCARIRPPRQPYRTRLRGSQQRRANGRAREGSPGRRHCFFALEMQRERGKRYRRLSRFFFFFSNALCRLETNRIACLTRR